MRVCSLLFLSAFSGSSCAIDEPCVPFGEYELFARRSLVKEGHDGGLANCPLELAGTLNVASESAAHFTLDGGEGGDCVITNHDFRPKNACQVALSCTADSGVSFSTYSFVGPEKQAVITGYQGGGPSPGLVWRAPGCSADYVWAGSLR